MKSLTLTKVGNLRVLTSNEITNAMENESTIRYYGSKGSNKLMNTITLVQPDAQVCY